MENCAKLASEIDTPGLVFLRSFKTFGLDV